jgi:hypothetical protein
VTRIQEKDKRGVECFNRNFDFALQQMNATVRFVVVFRGGAGNMSTQSLLVGVGGGVLLK